MKKLRLVAFLPLLIIACLSGYAQSSDKTLDNDSIQLLRDSLGRLSKEQLAAYSDSVYQSRYPRMKLIYAQDTIKQAVQPQRQQSTFSYSNSYVPNSVTISTSKSVGQIDIQSGMSPSGAKTYMIPIKGYHYDGAFCPEISLAYNSQGGCSAYGKGWSIDGLQSITRGNKTVFFDGKTEGMKMDDNDAFYLNGVRLVRTSSSAYEYETQQGNIKAVAIVSGNVVKYFNVYYPNGYTAVFGMTSTTQNKLEYPITTQTDERGRTITYSYISYYNTYNISTIYYDNNNASITFTYDQNRPDYVQGYRGGLQLDSKYLLKGISCTRNSVNLGQYSLTYANDANTPLMTQVDFYVNGNSLNPLKFYYGDNSSIAGYYQYNASLTEGYNYTYRNQMLAARGRFSYFTDTEGVLFYPNGNPYYYNNNGSDNYFSNKYNADDVCIVYDELYSNTINLSQNLTFGNGFVTMLTADLDGDLHESVIQVNNYVGTYYDVLTFKVYKRNAINLSLQYTRTYYYSLHTDGNGNKSVRPKYFYTGDFNGDGRMEVMVMTTDNPFGGTGDSSTCYIYDLKTNTTLYSGHVLDFYKEFESDTYNAANAENASDKVFPLDYDGDGKMDLCHVNANSTDLYTFTKSGNSLTSQQVSVDTNLRKGHFYKSFYSVGDFNGDGLMDIVYSSPTNWLGSKIWHFYFSKGNGEFEYEVSGNGPSTENTSSDFLIQDIDGDGISDIVELADNSFTGYMVKNNDITEGTTQSLNHSQGFLLPVNINSSTLSKQFVCLYDTAATLYSYKTNRRQDQALTGMASSYGAIEKNYYYTINSGNGIFTDGSGATFPYSNIFEAITVLAGSELFKDGASVDISKYFYNNAVLHRQGLGFRGFETITTRNKRNQNTYTTYEPYKYSLLKEVLSPTSRVVYTNDTIVDSYKRLKALVTSKVETDLLRNFSGTTTYTYDAYGQVLTENLSLPGSITVNKSNIYTNFTNISSKYRLGRLVSTATTTTRGSSQHTEQTGITSYNSFDQPLSIINKVNGYTIKTTSCTYDTSGNMTSSGVKPYSSTTTRTTSYQYTTGNLLTGITNPLGNQETYSYNSNGTISSKESNIGTTYYSYDNFGRLVSTTYPDGTQKTTAFSWNTANGGRYAVTESATNMPTKTTVYDALGREVRLTEKRYNGTLLMVDKLYDEYGNLAQESYPYKTGTPTYKQYTYDSYDRLREKTEAGKNTTYSYSGLSTTMSDGTMSTTTTEDALGGIVSVTDPAGTITYTLNGAGNATSISAPTGSGSGITTTMGYDDYERRISIADPSHGTTTYSYHNTEGYLQSETNARSQTTSYVCDIYGRMTQKTTPEFTTTYTYDNNLNKITAETSTNGTSTSCSYDNYGRLASIRNNGVDSKWLQRDYTYSGGRVSTIQYTSQSGTLATENYTYTNGHLTAVNLNGTLSIYQLSSENNNGFITNANTMGVSRNYGYNVSGLPTSRVAVVSTQPCQIQITNFNTATGNLTSRYNGISGVTENFTYDNLHRLTSFAGTNVVYDDNGNITTMGDVGTFAYNTTGKPYAVSDVTLSSNISAGTQYVSYYSFDRPSMITDNGYTATFTYNGKYDRVKMEMLHNSSAFLTRYYLGGCYELDTKPSGSKEKLYLMGGYYDAPVVLIKENGSYSYYNILRDHLGSITNIVGSSISQELSYDAWGRLRNPSTYALYTASNEPELLLGRGYCGHEHLPGLGLINMNARLYDPLLGRFLSSDPYVQAPDHSQSFNRYSYCLNNPLKNIDENGKWFFGTIFAAITDAIGNIFKHGLNVSQYNWTKTINAWRIDVGMVKGNFGQIVNKWTWSYPLSLLGKEMAHGLNMSGRVKSVTNMDGMLALSGVTNKERAFTIGHYSFGPNNYKATWKDHLFVHEYGHYIQGQIYGSMFIPLIGGPSLLSAMGIGGPKHDLRWFEVDASRKGAKHFDKLYGQGKDGYRFNSKDYFDITSFQTGGYSPYMNPRTGQFWQGSGNPIYGSESSSWDYLGPIVTILTLCAI